MFAYEYGAMKHLQSNTDLARIFIYNAGDERIAVFDCVNGDCTTQGSSGAPAPAGEQRPFYYYLGAPVSLGQRTDTIAVLDREGRRQPADPGVPAAVGR
ncbi:MAG TPA: hypothetical protein VGG06_03305 [Thermoanaerobaculia bacterium]